MKAAFRYGGQAVIEGVMMRGPVAVAVAVRRPDCSVVVDQRQIRSVTQRFPFLKWPFLRGVIVLVESLLLGIEALSYSAGQAAGEEEQLTTQQIAFTMIGALVVAILLFIVLPAAATHCLAAGVKSSIGQNLIEGAIRIAVLVAYIRAIAWMPEIRRVFQYHGAEHKVINSFEAGEELTVPVAKTYSTFHPRCGTSFLLIVMIVAILVFSLLGQQVLWWRLVSRVLLMPVVAGVSYEILKISGEYTNFFLCRLLIAPGRWLQGMTTKEPDNQQLEVAISALKAVLEEGENYVR